MESRLNLPTYLISLQADTTRRNALKQSFPMYYDSFIHIEAIDGRELSAKEYYKKTLPFLLKYQHPMIPAELGCTMSHIKALKEFLKTSHQFALILEDDIIGNDKDLQQITQLTSYLDINSLLLCGGQIDLPSKKYRLGKIIKDTNIYEVAKFSYSFIYGTCCYLVTRKSAQAIIDYHQKNLTLADKWDVFFRGTNIKIMYINILQHPLDYKNSHIEKDRIQRYNILLKKIKVDIFIRMLRKIKNELFRITLIIFGFKKLPTGR